MSIGITDEHVELAASLRKWAASLGGIEACPRRRGRPGRDVRRGLGGGRRDGRWPRSACPRPPAAAAVGARPGGRARGVRRRRWCPGPLLGTAVASVAPAASCRRRRGRRAGCGLGARPAGGRRLVGTDAVRVGRRHLLLLVRRGRAWFVVPATGSARRSDSPGPARPRPDPAVRSARSTSRPQAATGPGPDDELLRRTAVTLAAAEASGVARWCLDTAVEYARVREQFGQKIGSFQAIKHLCARDAGDRRVGHRRGLGRRVGAVTTTTSSGRSPRDVAGAVALRRRGRSRQGLHPGARRDRLHLRARRAPLPAPRAGPAQPARLARRVRRLAGRARRRRRTPPGRGRPRRPRRRRPRRRTRRGGARSPPARRPSGARRWSRPAT